MSGRKNDVLIIEDNVAITILLRDFLKKLGYENIEVCTNGKTGIRVFSELESAGKKPIVLLDFHLPDMNANEVMTSIFDIHPDTKIILETADLKSDEQIKGALRGGAYLYIEKPIRFENLKNVFETLEQERTILEEKPTEVIVSVKDNGRGMPAEATEGIFKKFYQVDTTSTREKGGSGLGLSICNGIVESHGGRIWMVSELSKGTIFSFTLLKTEVYRTPIWEKT